MGDGVGAGVGDYAQAHLRATAEPNEHPCCRACTHARVQRSRVSSTHARRKSSDIRNAKNALLASIKNVLRSLFEVIVEVRSDVRSGKSKIALRGL